MPDSSWPLFERFPVLSVLKPVALCDLPTPVEHLAGLASNAWLKRDDLTRTDQGGNKPRKLEFVLADIRRRKAKRVITLGATGTNAGVATALMCHREGLRCEVITFPQPDTAVVRANHQAMLDAGARLRARHSLLGAALNWYLHPRRLDPSSYFLYAGCSNPVATYAYINAALELAEQIGQGKLPKPAEIVVAAGSGATVAGLCVGAALALPGTRIHAVQVAPGKLGPFSVCHPDTINAMRRRAWKDLRRLEPALPASPADNLTWHDEYLGPGYGESTPAAASAMKSGATAGLTLETTYSGKSFACFLDRLEQADGDVLFWQTYGECRLEVRG